MVLFVLTAVCAIWMHVTVVRMLHRASPELSRQLEEKPPAGPPVSSSVTSGA
jgi:NNP family nitrate/nitrite transporter-like MFS transporter